MAITIKKASELLPVQREGAEVVYVKGGKTITRKRVQLFFDVENPNSASKTQQHFKDEADIDKIMERFDKTGELTVRRGTAQYADFSEFPQDLLASQNALIEANQKFLELPSSLRTRFDNDPLRLLEFVMDNANYDEAVKLGLVKPKVDANGSASPTPAPGTPAAPGAA